MDEFSGDFDNIKNSKNYQNQITNPAEPKNEQLAEIQYRALLKTQLQDLLEKSEQATQDLGNFKSALEANQLRQKLSGTVIQAWKQEPRTKIENLEWKSLIWKANIYQTNLRFFLNIKWNQSWTPPDFRFFIFLYILVYFYNHRTNTFFFPNTQLLK